MSSISTAAVTAAAPSRPFGRVRLTVLTAVAALVNLIVFWIAGSAGASMAVTQPMHQVIPALVVVLATVIPVGIGAVVTWFVARRWPGFRRLAAWVGLAIGVLSAPATFLVSADLPTAVALSIMHVMVGIAWFIGLRNTPARKEAQP